MLFWQILIDGFAISSLYALGATGFTLIFGVTGVLNLSHGAIMVAAAVAAWAASGNLGAGAYLAAAFGVVVALLLALLTYYLVVRRLQLSRAVREEEKEIFILTATLLWGIMIQEAIAYLFTNNAKTVLPIVDGVVTILGVRTPANEIFTALVCWATIGGLWLFVNRTLAGKAVLAASMNPRGVTLLGIELATVYVGVWAIYGALAGVAGVLLGMFLGVSSYSAGPLTASAFSIVVLGGLGSVSGSLIAAYVVGYLETLTAYLISPAYRAIPALLLLVAVMYVRPARLVGQAFSDSALGESRHREPRSGVAIQSNRRIPSPPGSLRFARDDGGVPVWAGQALDDDCPRVRLSAGPDQPDCRSYSGDAAALCLGLCAGAAHHRLLFRRVLDGLGSVVRLRQRSELRSLVPDRTRRLYRRHPRQPLPARRSRFASPREYWRR